jgi:lysophospholipase L1-like esterase
MLPTFSRRRFVISSALAAGAGALWPRWATAVAPGPRSPSGLVFLFQGDSITDGNRGRSADPNHVLGHGYAFAVASRIGADFSAQDPVFYNRGISGNTVGDLQARWPTDALALQPDVLSILVGINDIDHIVNQPAQAETLADFERHYRALLTASKAQKPATLFVLGLTFAYPVGRCQANWAQWQAALRAQQAVVRQLATEFDAVLVDYPAVLDHAAKHKPIAYWVWDGIHPTAFAHELMARAWLKQVSARLPFLRKYHT